MVVEVQIPHRRRAAHYHYYLGKLAHAPMKVPEMVLRDVQSVAPWLAGAEALDRAESPNPVVQNEAVHQEWQREADWREV